MLVARRGHDGGGYLQIEVRRDGDTERHAGRGPGAPARLGRGRQLLPVDRLAARPPVYDATQSRIHVIVTKRFLRSLARLDFAESRVGALPQLAPAPQRLARAVGRAASRSASIGSAVGRCRLRAPRVNVVRCPSGVISDRGSADDGAARRHVGADDRSGADPCAPADPQILAVRRDHDRVRSDHYVVFDVDAVRRT